jgi:hypothetical protein
MARHPHKSVGDAFCTRLPDIYAVAPIMVHGRSQVPTWDSMRCPGAPYVRLFVNEYSNAWRSKGGAVEVEYAIDMSVGQLCM